MAAQKAMHKDANLRKRNALVIPGGLLALYGFLGILYVVALRGDEGSCGDASLIVFLGACRSALLVLAIPAIIGLALVAVGALAYRNQATCRAGHGSWTHFGLAFLISLTVIPLLGMLLAPSLVGADAVITRGTVDYPVSTVLAALTFVGLLMFIPFAILYAAQARANPCCHEKGCFDPCFCDEAVTDAAPPEAVPVESPAPAPEPAPLPEPPAPQPVPIAAAPEAASAPEPDAQWEVLPDEPAPEPAPEPARKLEQGSAPALATRPTDPAAPPADAMAVAAKWAEEDEEALAELGPPAAATGRRKLAKGKKKAVKASKPAKKAKGKK